jgi:hypothetical protein
MAEFSLEALKDEIVNDPNGLGYKNSATPNDWKGDQVIADLINDNTTGLIVDREKMSAAAIRSNTTFDAYEGIVQDRQEWLRWLTGSNGFEEENLPVTADLKLQLTGKSPAVAGVGGTGAAIQSFWAAGERDEMTVAMLALIEVDASRAQVLWGASQSPISLSEVGEAFNLI